MSFGENLKKLRTDAAMTQSELAGRLGITTRTLINYESGKCYPKQSELYAKLSALFGVSADSLLGSGDYYISEAERRGGRQAARDMTALIEDAGGLFAGGELSEDDKDKLLRKITELYWQAKEQNRKYAPKKHS